MYRRKSLDEKDYGGNLVGIDVALNVNVDVDVNDC